MFGAFRRYFSTDLAIDLGTGGPKAALVTPEGRITAHEFEPTPLELLGNGGAEQDPDAWFEGGADDGFKAQVEALLEARAAARAAKDWGEADRIRDELTALNVVVMDGPTGATWRRG